jgi:hypothetical protein
MDPFGHPDLERLARTLRTRLDETLDAEQSAARSAALRRRSLRDRFIEAEDRAQVVIVSSVDGQTSRGTITAVGIDHVVVTDGHGEKSLAIAHVVSMECR